MRLASDNWKIQGTQRISALEEQIRKIQGDFFKNNHAKDEYFIDIATVNDAFNTIDRRSCKVDEMKMMSE